MSSKMEDRYEGAFLDALDLPEGIEAPVTVESIAEPFMEKDSAGKVIKSAILAFKDKKKRLVLNKTNFRNLKAMFGKNPGDWIGKQIKIQRRYLDAAHGFGVNNTLCIRIIPPTGTPILSSAARFMGSPEPYGQNEQTKKLPPTVPRPKEKPLAGITNKRKWSVPPEQRATTAMNKAEETFKAGDLPGLKTKLEMLNENITDFPAKDVAGLRTIIQSWIDKLESQKEREL